MLSEVVKAPARQKPPLGPPHDAYATLLVTIALAAFFLTTGWARVEQNWVAWCGFGLALAALFSTGHYFKRAYGFSNQMADNLPRGAVATGLMCLMFGLSFITPALYNQYAAEGLFGLSVTFLVLAGLIMAPLRAALGKAAPQAAHERPAES